MDAREHLEQIIDERQGRLAAGIPSGREAALLALLRWIDRLPLDPASGRAPDIVTGRRAFGLGIPTALRLCLTSPGPGGGITADPDGWAAGFLDDCRQLEASALVARFSATGAMGLAEREPGVWQAWLSGGRVPSLWRERAEIDWWARHLREREPRAGRANADEGDFGTAARAVVGGMAYQLGYPDDAILCGCQVGLYREVLAEVLARALELRDRRRAAEPVAESGLVSAIVAALAADRDQVAFALSALILDRENAAWHAALPAGPQAPLVRVGAGRVAWSLRGLLAEPLFFLGRELRRRDTEGYHNAAVLRESVFREDLYALFADRRFVRSTGRIVLRWDDRRSRTDVDAAIFDRKTGTLGLFELKSQDPFARTVDELDRRRENLRRAGQQVSAVLDWLNRHGADELLTRIDASTAKRFRVQRVLPFVLGRYGADTGIAASPKRRAAWGSWPQVLRARDGGNAANPLLALHTRLLADPEPGLLPPRLDMPPAEIRLGDARLEVYPSWAAARRGRRT